MMNSTKKIILPDLEDITENQSNLDSKKYKMNSLSYLDNFEKLSQNNNLKNNNNVIKGQSLDKYNKINDKGNNPKRDFEENTNKKNLENEKLLEYKIMSIKNENQTKGTKSIFYNDGSTFTNNEVEEGKSARNSENNLNLQNVLIDDNKILLSKLNEKDIKDRKKKSLDKKNHILIENFRNMLIEASSNILIKNELPEKARKIEELKKVNEELKKEKNLIERAFDEREKFYDEKINLLEKQLNDPITEDISSIQAQIKEYDNQILILNKSLKEIKESNNIEKENFYKITSEVINSKKKLSDELQDLEKYKKLFFIGNPATNINVNNKPEVVLKFNFDESVINSHYGDNSFVDKSYKIINNSNYNNKDSPKQNYYIEDNSSFISRSNTQRNRSVNVQPKLGGYRSSSGNYKPLNPEIKITLTKKN